MKVILSFCKGSLKKNIFLCHLAQLTRTHKEGLTTDKGGTNRGSEQSEALEFGCDSALMI